MVSLLLLPRPRHTLVTLPLPHFAVYKLHVQNTLHPQSELRLCCLYILLTHLFTHRSAATIVTTLGHFRVTLVALS